MIGDGKQLFEQAKSLFCRDDAAGESIESKHDTLDTEFRNHSLKLLDGIKRNVFCTKRFEVAEIKVTFDTGLIADGPINLHFVLLILRSIIHYFFDFVNRLGGQFPANSETLTLGQR